MTAYSYAPRPSLTPLLLPILLYVFYHITTPPATSSTTTASTTPPPFDLPGTRNVLLSTTILTRLHALANITATPPYINRPYLSEFSIAAQNQIASWMQQAGLTAHIDAAGNVIGDLSCPTNESRKKVLLGSHHDTVPNAGRYDGLYGVISSISVAQLLSPKICNLPFDVRVIAFDDEEGNNPFGTTNMGSRAYTGTINWEDFNKQSFVTAYQTLHGNDPIPALNSARGEIPLAYLELHLEQGPVLESRNKAVGIVDAIAGQTRIMITLKGQSGHAGTVPMDMRHDALTTAAEGILGVEHPPIGVVGTVGMLNVAPNVVNVIPGLVHLSVDIRSRSDKKRTRFVHYIIRKFHTAGLKHGVGVTAEVIHDIPALDMSEWLMDAMKNVNGVDGGLVTSGGGHDAQIMASVTDVGMLFVRCRDGVSHRPDEFVSDDDVFRGAKALLNAVLAIGERVRIG